MSIEFDICNEIAYLRNNNIATDRLRFLEDKLHTMNVENRNNQLVSSMARKILKNENINQKILKMLQMTNNKLEHALIYGPTQIGKTNAIIQFIKTCIEQKIPTIVSSDNQSTISKPGKIIEYLLRQPNMECNRDTMINDLKISIHNIEDCSTSLSNQGFLITNANIIKFNPNIIDKILMFHNN
jgi:hypothetical protein